MLSTCFGTMCAVFLHVSRLRCMSVLPVATTQRIPICLCVVTGITCSLCSAANIRPHACKHTRTSRRSCTVFAELEAGGVPGANKPLLSSSRWSTRAFHDRRHLRLHQPMLEGQAPDLRVPSKITPSVVDSMVVPLCRSSSCRWGRWIGELLVRRQGREYVVIRPLQYSSPPKQGMHA